MHKYRRAISDNFLFFAISTIFFLVVTHFAIKVMGEEFYGLWAVLIALMLFSNVGNLGIGSIVMKFSSEVSKQDNILLQPNQVMTAGYFITFVMAIITAGVLLFGRNLIADHINTSVEFRDQFRQAILWIVASIFPQFLASVPQGFLLSQLNNRVVRQIEFFSSVTLWAGAFAIVLVEKNLILVAGCFFFSSILTLGLYLRAVKALGIPIQLQTNALTLRKMLNFSGWMFLQSLAIVLFQQIDRVIISFTLGPAQAGAYSIGTSLALRLSMITGQATEVMIPYASLKESLSDQETLYKTFRQLSRYISLSLAGISSLLIIWMNEILSLWISPDYAMRYTSTFRVLIIAYNLLALSRPAHQTLTGIGKVKLVALIYSLSTLLMLTGVFFLSKWFGFAGAVAANLLMTFLLAYNLLVYYTLQKPIQWHDAFADLQAGLFIPMLIFASYLFLPESNIIYKLTETILLGIFFTWIITKDTFAKAELSRMLQSISKPKT